ncbi:MAG TPA: ribonuclease R [Phycisphaerae bacterium]|nr:ribonuclease R [Phycisphaerae bacterium]
MSKRFSDRILDFIKQPAYEPMRTKNLARAMGIAQAEMSDFHDAVDALRRLGRVVIGSSSAVNLPRSASQMVGVYRGNPRGFGFVVPDEPSEHGDLHIPQGESKDAITGDRVLCSVFSRGKREGKQAFGGRVVEIVERGNSKFVGTLHNEGSMWYVEADGNALHGPILIGDPHAKGARAGDSVVLEIVRYPGDGEPARGVIVERLGQRGEPGVDLEAIIRQYHLPNEFPEEVLEVTRATARAFDPDVAAEGRDDLSGMTIITIDPDDARDFDDAISLERLAANRGGRDGDDRGREWHRAKHKAGSAAWELGVHIADVSHFVRLGSEIDTEARERGTSVYLPGRVLPMLPEILSNGLCSLQEGEPRLAKSAFIRYDADGRVVATRFANTIIRSAKRLTYGDAQAIVDGKNTGFDRAAVELVQKMEKLARIIRQRRLKDGMIVLDLPAVELVYDPDGRVVDAQPEDTSFSHTIIEMFMVEANEAVARLLTSLGAPFLRRVHAPPEEESLTTMAKFLRGAGLFVPKSLEPSDLQQALEKLRGKPEGYAVNLAVLKSMQMAEYSPQEIGHFALASEDYAHFTSPIRRYPDLMVHRLLDLYFDGRLPVGKRRGGKTPPALVSQEDLKDAGRRMSYLARRAESAERELKTLKVLALLDKQIGETFEGVVTGVTNFGLFIQHPKYLIDGLVRMEDLGDDWWEVDAKAARVRGERTGKTFTLGTRVTVQIANVHLPSRQLSLALPGTRPRQKVLSSPPTPQTIGRNGKLPITSNSSRAKNRGGEVGARPSSGKKVPPAGGKKRRKFRR